MITTVVRPDRVTGEDYREGFHLFKPIFTLLLLIIDSHTLLIGLIPLGYNTIVKLSLGLVPYYTNMVSRLSYFGIKRLWCGRKP